MAFVMLGGQYDVVEYPYSSPLDNLAQAQPGHESVSDYHILLHHE